MEQSHRGSHSANGRALFRRIWRVFFGFMAALLTTLLVAVSILISTVLSKEFLLQHMDATNYYVRAAEVVQEECVNLSISSGVPESFFSDFIDRDELYKDIRESVNSSFSGEKSTLDRKALKAQFYQKFVNYAQSQQIEVTPDIASGLSTLGGLCVTAYARQADHALLRYLGEFSRRFSGWAWGAVALLLVLDLLSFWMVYLLSKLKHQAIRRWNSSLLGGALMLIAVPLWMMLSRGVEQFKLTSPSLYPLMVSYVNASFRAFIICGAVLGLAALTVGAIGAHLLKHRH